MIIICESGATKGDWRVIEGGRQIAAIQTAGTNVSAMGASAVEAIIRSAAASLPAGPYEAVYFYTAGVIVPEILAWLEPLLKECFVCDSVEVQSDLVAAARAACGHEPGIALILGTGCSSCEYDGREIVKRVPSGGYIIGDEGSASVLGRLFISDYIKNQLPAAVAQDFTEKYGLDYPAIVQKVYHNEGSPSGWLGSLCPFILSHYADPYIKAMVDGNFQSLVDRGLKQYDTARYPVGIIGGFGNALRDIVSRIFAENGIRIRAFIPSPIEELITYHA